MALKDILLHLDSGKTTPLRLDAAIDLARGFDAHLTGLYVLPRLFIPAYAEIPIPEEIIAAQQAEAQATAAKIEQEFKASTGRAGCSAEWRCVEGDPIDQVNLHARYTDLVVLGQAEEDRFLSLEAALNDEVLMGAARPVLFIPYIGAKGMIGKRVLIAWKDSREAVRAVNDALPLLKRAEAVEVLSVNPPEAEGDIPNSDICLHLARHGVNAIANKIIAKDIEVGALLLSRAADQAIDLIVMGAYGHTRMRETILGGVTRHLLGHMTVPVLMSR